MVDEAGSQSRCDVTPVEEVVEVRLQVAVVHGRYALLVLGFFFLAVLAEARNAAAVGAPLDPGFRIFSLEPALMRLRFAWMFA